MSAPLAVAIAGLGAIGGAMVREIARAEPRIRIAAVGARDEAKAKALLADAGVACPLLPLERLPDAADIVVECLPAASFDTIADATLAAGKGLMVLSAGQLARRDDLIPAFRARNQRLIVPTGAILGLDVVRALARGPVEACTIVTRKGPRGLAGAPHLVANGIDPLALTEPTLVFSGSARQAIAGSRPTSTWRSRFRSPASGSTGLAARSGSTPAKGPTSTRSRCAREGPTSR